jgi:hypothetical protein
MTAFYAFRDLPEMQIVCLPDLDLHSTAIATPSASKPANDARTVSR